MTGRTATATDQLDWTNPVMKGKIRSKFNAKYRTPILEKSRVGEKGEAGEYRGISLHNNINGPVVRVLLREHDYGDLKGDELEEAKREHAQGAVTFEPHIDFRDFRIPVVASMDGEKKIRNRDRPSWMDDEDYDL